jgi:hypothetical protein
LSQTLSGSPNINGDNNMNEIVIGTATKKYNATNINLLSIHAISLNNMKPLCSDKLNTLTYEERTEANINNVTCRNCLKKLNPLAIDYYKPVKIVKVN